MANGVAIVLVNGMEIPGLSSLMCPVICGRSRMFREKANMSNKYVQTRETSKWKFFSLFFLWKSTSKYMYLFAWMCICVYMCQWTGVTCQPAHKIETLILHNVFRGLFSLDAQTVGRYVCLSPPPVLPMFERFRTTVLNKYITVKFN